MPKPKQLTKHWGRKLDTGHRPMVCSAQRCVQKKKLQCPVILGSKNDTVLWHFPFIKIL